MKRSPLPRRNIERAKRLFKRNFHSQKFVEFTRTRPCATCGSRPSQCSHAEPRGMGGCGADWTRIFPQCRDCHRDYGEHYGAFMDAKRLTTDDIDRFITEHQQAWKRYQEGIQL